MPLLQTQNNSEHTQNNRQSYRYNYRHTQVKERLQKALTLGFCLFVFFALFDHLLFLMMNTTQKYFLLTDTAATLFWTYVLARLVILYPLTGARFLPGGLADFYLSVLVGTCALELFNYASIFRHLRGTPTIYNALPKPYWVNLLLTNSTRLLLAFVIYNYPKVARTNAFPLLVASQSIKELFRWYYNIEKVRLYNNVSKTAVAIRKITFLIATPLEASSIFYILFQSLPVESYQDALLPYDTRIKTLLKAILLGYFPAFYALYKRSIYKYFFVHSRETYQKKQK